MRFWREDPCSGSNKPIGDRVGKDTVHGLRAGWNRPDFGSAGFLPELHGLYHFSCVGVAIWGLTVT